MSAMPSFEGHASSSPASLAPIRASAAERPNSVAAGASATNTHEATVSPAVHCSDWFGQTALPEHPAQPAAELVPYHVQSYRRGEVIVGPRPGRGDPDIYPAEHLVGREPCGLVDLRPVGPGTAVAD